MFSISTCAKCGGGMFKVVTQEPAGSNYKSNFIQCSSCNAPIGVVDYYNTGAQLEEQKALINNLGSRLPCSCSGVQKAAPAEEPIHAFDIFYGSQVFESYKIF
jgi:hypothetical protein